MGVDWRAGLARGYKVSYAELDEAAKIFESNSIYPHDEMDIVEYLYDLDILICIDGYSAEPDYILGYDICSCSDDAMAEYVEDLVPDEGKDSYIEGVYQEFFTRLGNTPPRTICYLSVT